MTRLLETAADGSLTIPAEALPGGQSTVYAIETESEVTTLRPAPRADLETQRRAQMEEWNRQMDAIRDRIAADWPEGLSAVDAVREQRR